MSAEFALAGQGACRHLADIDQMAGIGWQLPAGLSPGRYRIRAEFCSNPWRQMPLEISTPPFECR